MAIWDRFKRNNSEDIGMPAEVQEYYKAESRSRNGMAWILAISTLVVTLALAAALFFGGRWIYQTIFGDDESNQTEEVMKADEKLADDKSDEGAVNTNAGATTPSTSTPAPQTPTTPAPAPQPSSAPTTSTIPSTGPATLVNTGPGDE